MSPLRVMTSPFDFARVRSGATPLVFVASAAALGFLAPLAFVSPRWLSAVGLALGIFFLLKLLSLRGAWAGAHAARVLAYLAIWPGMNARTFLDPHARPRRIAAHPELGWGLVKMGAGLTLAAWAATHASTAPVWCVGWAGMVGAIFVFHFGLFHVLSWLWRRAGVDAPPLMRAPIVAGSLAEFWGERWNTAFAELARRFVLRPLARRWGVARAGALVFLVSGLVHELAISLPARGGWGGPTVYFLLQGAGLAVEKSRAGRLRGLGGGWRGHAWTLLCTAIPLPLLFHPPLVERVVVPFFRFLEAL